jgi:hypothetical protein
MLHCSIHSYRTATTDEWRKCLGISSYNHEALRTLQVTNIRPDHPIMRGFPRSWTAPADELYKIGHGTCGFMGIASLFCVSFAYGKYKTGTHILSRAPQHS